MILSHQLQKQSSVSPLYEMVTHHCPSQIKLVEVGTRRITTTHGVSVRVEVDALTRWEELRLNFGASARSILNNIRPNVLIYIALSTNPMAF